MDDGDKLAIATLAAARCAALGQHDVDHYIAQYEEFERQFEQRRRREVQQAGDDNLGTWANLGGGQADA